MTNLTQFSFEGSQMRTIIENGKTYFVAADVCQILNYAQTAPAIKKHCKQEGVIKRHTPTSSGEQEMVCITEGNLYRLIAKSKMPHADKFESWIFDEVLPSIRKTGSYEAKPQYPTTQAELLLQTAQVLVLHETKILQLENKVSQIEAKQQTAPDYFAICGFAALNKIPIDLKVASTLGKKASTLCNQLGFMMGTVPDPRFGKVKTYPKDVLETVFSEYKKAG